MSGPRKTKFLDPHAADAAIAEVTGTAGLEQISIALIGGLAMQLYGSDRLTTDVDFVADRESESNFTLNHVSSIGSIGGVRGYTSTGVHVDVIVRTDVYADLYLDACQRARVHDGVRLVSREHLAAMKFLTRRPKDRLDLEFLVRTGRLSLATTFDFIFASAGQYAAEGFAEELDLIALRAARETR